MISETQKSTGAGSWMPVEALDDGDPPAEAGLGDGGAGQLGRAGDRLDRPHVRGAGPGGFDGPERLLAGADLQDGSMMQPALVCGRWARPPR
jgi:hypothetical protein